MNTSEALINSILSKKIINRTNLKQKMDKDNEVQKITKINKKKKIGNRTVCERKLCDDIVLIILSFITNFNMGTFVEQSIMSCFWILVSLLSSLYISIDREDIVFHISTLEIIIGSICTLILLYGIEKNEIKYLVPWMLYSTWNVFTHKFFALEFVLFYYYNEKYGLIASIFGLITLCLKSLLWVKSVKVLIDIE